MSRILLIEDHPSLGDTIAEYLRRAGHTVDLARTLAAGWALLADVAFDLVLLDLGLPDGDGLDLLRHKAGPAPVLVLTARGTLSERIEGLDRGADDYMVKPFALEELDARCRTLLRRAGGAPRTQVRLGRLSLDTATQALEMGDIRFDLSRRERQLLMAMMQRPGKVCTRQYLETQLYDQSEPVGPNALETSISRLRVQLCRHDCGVEVRTIRGVGYMLEARRNAGQG
jgi:two-component system response regulator QseB